MAYHCNMHVEIVQVKQCSVFKKLMYVFTNTPSVPCMHYQMTKIQFLIAFETGPRFFAPYQLCHIHSSAGEQRCIQRTSGERTDPYDRDNTHYTPLYIKIDRYSVLEPIR